MFLCLVCAFKMRSLFPSSYSDDRTSNFVFSIIVALCFLVFVPGPAFWVVFRVRAHAVPHFLTYAAESNTQKLSHPCKCLSQKVATYVLRVPRIVRLYLSTYPLVWGWYFVVKSFLIDIIRQNTLKNFEVKHSPLSATSPSGAQKLNTQEYTNCFLTSAAKTPLIFIVLVTFENLSMITRGWLFPMTCGGMGRIYLCPLTSVAP